MARERIKLTANVPVLLTLKYSCGREMPDNGYGKSVLYTTTDDRALYVNLEESLRISQLRLAPGESFLICKCVRKGERSSLHVKLSPATEAMRAAKKPAEVPQPPAAPRPMPMPPAMARRLDSHPVPPQKALAATGTDGPVSRPAPRQPSAVPTRASYGSAMTEFLLIAGRATKEAEKVLGAEGGSVRFDSRDVAALATTAFIQAARAGRITWAPGERS